MLFLNPDVRLDRRCVARLLRVFNDPQVGVSGPVVRVVVSDVVEYGATLDLLGYPVALRVARPPLYVPGCALATRTAVFHQLGGFDDRFFMFVEDVDYCWRVLLAGWEVRVAEGAMVVHVGGAATPGGYLTSTGLRTTRFRVVLRERNTLAMLLKCYGRLSAGVLIPAYVLQTTLTAGLLALLGKTRTARQMVGGLLWNVRELRRTLALRKKVQAHRRISDWVVWKRMRPGFRKAELLVRYGMPRVLDV